MATLNGQLRRIVRKNQPCTVRQAYYRAVVAYLCDKTDSGYNLIQRRLLHLRRSGLIPYGWIEDGSRSHDGKTRYTNLEQFADHSKHLFHFDYWQDNPVKVEIWCESDSISGTFRQLVIDDYGLDVYVAKGFSSETYLFNADQTMLQDGRPHHVYILSGFDPSGVSLAEDISRKIQNFTGDLPVTVERIALTARQVNMMDLPTHPLKKSDKRAKRFRQEYGDEACELEAMAPGLARTLVQQAIERHIPKETLEKAKQSKALQRESIMHLPEFFRNLRL